MPWLIVLTLAWGLVGAAATASAAVYVPGHLRDGVYTRPHFLDSPGMRYDREIKLESKAGQPPKPAGLDAKPPPQKPSADTSS